MEAPESQRDRQRPPGPQSWRVEVPGRVRRQPARGWTRRAARVEAGEVGLGRCLPDSAPRWLLPKTTGGRPRRWSVSSSFPEVCGFLAPAVAITHNVSAMVSWGPMESVGREHPVWTPGARARPKPAGVHPRGLRPCSGPLVGEEDWPRSSQPGERGWPGSEVWPCHLPAQWYEAAAPLSLHFLICAQGGRLRSGWAQNEWHKGTCSGEAGCP